MSTYQANPERIEQWRVIYTEELQRAVAEHPQDYPWHPALPVATVVARMTAALATGSFNLDGHAIKATARRLGLKHTRKAIVAFLIGVQP